MLELKNIVKIYPSGGDDVKALKGIDLKFRESEFVAILGPSGCGKTTMLNIIGGLDSYTSGDLIINGKSTKEYKDRDWDTYRNHSVGFVFQNYNLIPHQSVLQNVELALTLSGVSRGERRKRAKAALEEVGLGNQLRKKPSEMSGGQMQRVAIARAIVNNPDILLADEPTGALDTETSIQVMDILKEISKNRLVVMVTHNPELAEKYSTRTVRMLDGVITDDSAPLSDEEYKAELLKDENKTTESYKKKKPSMSFGTSFGLSLKNLFTKKGRTILTSFAGSIGIIGIALIYSVSNGTTTFINTIQEQTLSSYPLTIEAQSVDLSSLISTFIGKAKSTAEHEDDAVYQKAMIYEMMNSLNSLEEQENDLKSFKKHIEEQRTDETSKLYTAVSGVQYAYNNDLIIYTENVDGKIIHSDTETLMADIMKNYAGMDMTNLMTMREQSGMGSASSFMESSSALWKELIPGDNGNLVSDVTKSQYDLLYGRWPTSFNEIVLFVDKNNELNDLTLYALGLKPEEDVEKLMTAAKNKETVEYDLDNWSYEDICNMDFRTILNSNCFVHDEKSGFYTDLRETETGLKYLYDNGLKLHVVGIVKLDKDAVAANENGHIGYTYKLTEYVISQMQDSDAIKAQQKNAGTDIFTGLPFKDNDGKIDDAKKAAEFKEYINKSSDTEKADAYIRIMSIPSDEEIKQTVAQTMANLTRSDMEATLSQAMTEQMKMSESDVKDYITAMSDDEISGMFAQMIEEQFKEQYASQAAEQLALMTPEQLVGSLEASLPAYTDEQCAKYYDEILEFSDSTYEDNLHRLGCIDLDSPSEIYLYASTFADKDLLEEAIADYNDGVDDLREIKYTDYVGFIMSSVTKIIKATSYVLIAFVAVSLIVSSIMIGVITLISVQERTKEIGILRAIGASKKNVSNMFNAETVIIGFASGVLGVLITYLLCIPINMLLHHWTGLSSLNASLPLPVGLILIAISVLLTLFAGIIPSRSAAKKDPVVALRTE